MKKDNFLNCIGTFGEWMDVYFTKYKALEVKESSLDTYKNAYRTRVSGTDFDSIPLKEISPADVQDLYNRLLEEGYSRSSIENVSSIISSSMKQAKLLGLIDSVPTDYARIPRNTRERTHAAAMTRAEQKLMMKTADKLGFYDLFNVMLNTGIRLGELQALRHGSVDFKSRTLRITLTTTFSDRRLIEGTPKSRSSIREIPLTKKAVSSLMITLERQKKNNIPASPDQYVFTGNDKKMLSRKAVRWRIEKCEKDIRRSGIDFPHVTPHCFRATFATRCAESGMDMNVLKKLLGHSKLSITMDLYAQVQDDYKRRAMEMAESVL